MRSVVWDAPSQTASIRAPATRITLRWILRVLVALAFLSAFMQYIFSSAGAAFLPLMIIGICALLVLGGRQRNNRIQQILGGGGLVFSAMLFGEVVSYTSHDSYSQIYGLVFIGLFLCVRLIVLEIGVAEVIRAYSQAAILTAGLILIAGRQTLFTGGTIRFTGGTHAHPNLVGFVLGGYFPVIVWRAMEEAPGRKRVALIALSVATFGMVFLTGSRGTLSAVLFAGIALLLRGTATGWFQRLRIRHLHIIAFVVLMPLVVAFLFQHNRIGRMSDFVNDFLALKTSQRGLKSGLSGRTGIWQIAFRVLEAHDRWLFGFGYRAGDRMVGTIDNGYVQLLFESGALAGGLILGSILRVFFLLWKASRGLVTTAWTRYYMMLWCLMIVYFLNNISARYLFSFGSPFSLCVLFLMAASRSELVGGGQGAVPQGKSQPVSQIVA